MYGIFDDVLNELNRAKEELEAKGYDTDGITTFEIAKGISFRCLKIKNNVIITDTDIPNSCSLIYVVNYPFEESRFYHSNNKHMFIEDNDFKSFFGMVIVDEGKRGEKNNANAYGSSRKHLQYLS